MLVPATAIDSSTTIGNGDDDAALEHDANWTHTNSRTQTDIAALEVIGRLALKCISFEVYDRPSMMEVIESLEKLRRSWKKQLTDNAKADHITGIDVTKPDGPLDSKISNSS